MVYLLRCGTILSFCDSARADEKCFAAFVAHVEDFCFSQEDTWQWWNQEHGWDWGEPGWRNWVIFAPGNLGPNALPVPEMKRGILPEAGEIKSTFSSHFHPGDPTQDLSFHLTVPFDGGKVAVEAYGVAAEYYHYDEEIRNRRFSRDVDGKGLAWGDFYFSTLIQICKERAFPIRCCAWPVKLPPAICLPHGIPIVPAISWI